MADNIYKYGFRWVRAAGGSQTPQLINCIVADAYQAQVSGSDVDIGVGDPVKLVSTGTVALAAATEPVYGVIMGVEQYFDGSVVRKGPVVPGGSTGSGVVSRQTRVKVALASWGLWEIDVDDSSTATTEAAYQALINENADISFTRAQVNNSWRANPKLDISTHATTAGLVTRIMGVSHDVSNRDFSGANVKLLVAFNKIQEAGAAATTIAGV